MNNKMVSVIIPTYGRPYNLKRAIQSVIKQTYSNWELIIVDDNNPNSEDRKLTIEIVADYLSDKRCCYLLHDKNRNGSAARNTGLKAANGDYIAFLDDDDEFLPNRLEECVKKLSGTDDKIGGAYTGCSFYKDGKKYRDMNLAPNGNYLVETLATCFNSYSGSNFVLKKRVFTVVGDFDESFIRHQDYEFLVRFFGEFDLVGINKCLLVKNELGTNIPNIEKMFITKLQYLDKYRNIISLLSNNDRNFIYFMHYYQLSNMAYATNRDKGNEFYSIAVKYKKPSIKELLRHYYMKHWSRK